MVCGRGSGRSQLKSVSGTDRVRLCGHVKLSLINSADYPEYPDRKVGVRACATSSASCGLNPSILNPSCGLVNPSIQKVRTKFIKKHELSGCSQARHRGSPLALGTEGLPSSSTQRAFLQSRHREFPLGLGTESILSGLTQRAFSTPCAQRASSLI